MNVIYLFCALLVAGGQPGSAAWYEKKAADAIAKAQSTNKAEAMRLIDEMRKTAEAQGSQDWKLWVEWKKGQCEYYLGDLSQSIATWEKIEPLKSFLLRHVVVRDLGDAHLESGNPAKAEIYLKDAAGMSQKFEATERVSINLKLIQCQVGLARMAEARHKLVAERKALDNIKTGADPEQWTCLDARWNLLQAGMDLEARNPLRALIRLDASQKSLKNRFPNSPESLDLRFKCHIGLAADYWLVARFADADAHLTLAEKIVSSVKTERNLASLKNARAALIIEKVALDLENEFQAPQILDNLNKAQANLDAALGHLKNTGSGADFLAATIDFQLSQVHELRGRVLDAHGEPKEAKVEFRMALESCDKTLKWRNGVYKTGHDLVLEVRNRRAWLNLRLGNAEAAQKEGAEALKLFDGAHKKNDLDRGRYLHVLFEAENQLGNITAAIQYAQEHRRLVDDGLATLVGGLAASEQIQFFRRWDTPGLNSSLRMAIQHAADPNVAAASVEWLINGKAKLAEVLATQVKAARQADRQEFAKLQKSVQRQAFLLYGESTTDLESLRREFLFEESTKRTLAEAAAKPVGPEPRWYTLPEVRAHLGEDELYVGIYCLRPREGARRV